MDPAQTTSCPICGGNGHQAAAYHAEEAAQAFIPRRLDPDRHAALTRNLTALWQDGPCILRRCDRCDFVYADPFVAGGVEFYALAYCGASYPRRKWEFDRTRWALRERGLERARILEVGAGNGAFLRQLLEDGSSPASLLALEFSSSGRAEIESLGVNCLAADLRTAGIGDTFDVVCMFQVLEHLDGYDGVFETLARVVRRGGHLFIATPNGAWISSNESWQLLRDMPPNHISRWSPLSFAALAHRYGWHLEACEFEPASLARTVARVLTDRFVRLVGDEAPWESGAAEWVSRLRNRSVARIIKAASALTSPACLSAALRAATATAISPNIWVHLTHPDLS